MTIVPFLRDSVFEPHDLQAMSKALQDVCQILNLSDQAGSEKELLARKIIAIAHEGSRDPAFLRDRTLREIVSNQGAWPAALVRTARWGVANVLRKTDTWRIKMSGVFSSPLMVAAEIILGVFVAMFVAAVIGVYGDRMLANRP
jgi:hypothetical protein